MRRARPRVFRQRARAISARQSRPSSSSPHPFIPRSPPFVSSPPWPTARDTATTTRLSRVRLSSRRASRDWRRRTVLGSVACRLPPAMTMPPRGRTGLDAEAGFVRWASSSTSTAGPPPAPDPAARATARRWREVASRADVHQGGVVRDLQARAVGDGRLDGRWLSRNGSRAPSGSAMMSARRLLHAEMNARSDAGSRARMS